VSQVKDDGMQPLWRGNVTGLYIAPAAGDPMHSLHTATLVEGRGIEGDRYYSQSGTHSSDDDEEPAYEVTLIEGETIEAIRRDKRMELDPGTPRRNIVTRGFALNHLVHRTFRIGEVVLRGIALREPCPNLLETTSHKLMVGLIHRGGLGAQIVKGGVIHVGDTIEEVHL